MAGSVKIRFFTRIAYYLLASQQKYRNIFIVMAVFAVSLVMTVSIALQVKDVFSSAAFFSSLLAATPNDSVLQKTTEQAWSTAWYKALTAAVWGCCMVCCAIVQVRMIKICHAFQQKSGPFWTALKK